MLRKQKNKYGQTTSTECMFCSQPAISRTPQGVPCCKKHTQEEIKCPIHRGRLDGRTGKFGLYFTCHSCGQNYSLYRLKQLLELHK